MTFILHKKNVLILCIFLIFCTPVQAAKFNMTSVAGEKVNLRAGPGPDHNILWEYGKGFPLRIVQTKGNWYKVVDFENDAGWVYKKLVTKDPHMIVKKKTVNIRSGPGSKYKLLGKANYGVVFKTLEQKSGWAKLQHENGLVGWIRRDLVWGW
nr:SH3 domain-containing protein [Desulfobulbaceae bacterium]